MRLLPIDLQLEAQLLASIFARPDKLTELRGRVSTKDFDDRIHGEAFSLILDAHADNQVPDLLVIDSRLRTLFGDEAAEFGRNVSNAEVSGNLIELADSVRDMAKRRTYWRLACDMRKGIESGWSLQDVRALADRVLTDEANDGNTTPALADEMQAALDERDEYLDRGEELDLKLGIDFLDNRMRFQRGSLTAVGAREKTGKTLLMQQIALNTSSLVSWYSTEMDRRDITPRIATAYGVDTNTKTPDRAAEAEVIAAVRNRGIRFSYESRLDVALTRAYVAHKQEGCNIFIFDYMQDMSIPREYGSGAEAYAEAARRIKRLAKETDSAVFMISSLRKVSDDEENDRPKVSQFFGTNQIAFTADNALVMWRPVPNIENLVCMHIPFSRGSQNRDWWYVKRDKRLRASEIDKRHGDDIVERGFDHA